MLLDHEGVPSMSLSGALSLNLMFTLDIFVVWFVDGKFIVSVCVSTLISLLSGINPISALNPDCSFVWFWDSPWYLGVLVADGTIMYDAYSHQLCDQWYCAFLPRSVSAACLQYVPVSCERDGLWARDLDTCKNSSGEALSIGTPCWQTCTVNSC